MKNLNEIAEEQGELSHEQRITEAQRLLEDAGPLATLEYSHRAIAATRVLHGEDPEVVATTVKSAAEGV